MDAASIFAALLAYIPSQILLLVYLKKNAEGQQLDASKQAPDAGHLIFCAPLHGEKRALFDCIWGVRYDLMLSKSMCARNI